MHQYSMIGQTTLGWIDRHCRQSTGRNSQVFGGKSIILTGDPGQLPPVCDKQLYHSKPSSAVGEQGYYAYNVFDKVVMLTMNQRVKGSNTSQSMFRNLLLRLRDGKSSKEDWKQLLTRQPSHVANIDCFQDSTRLFYSNEEVAKFNYDHYLLDLKQPIAQVNARHSTNKAKGINSQDMHGLQPTLLICKKARVMLTMNLWPSAGLCNGATGYIEDIIYAQNQEPPLLPIAVVVKFDNQCHLID
ncbi:ATP-dependent DNA helicase PIF1 [Paramuricea clavata]|uniref:ATP-dependent DNA helicase n=1 Tax=Paramuricea clavata TaxID=317549 RepID=A0A7D9H979_PARCT|nr:ATP-dependent DNA helicase PIF1 [Paramuricea clavata]